ncbi:MAG TPA: PqqD family peptide modification chaperone [Steroidobacteraceae bacterium]|nr:PqqD family peptide modification chaperone [Steroidobacteraceae bacterium]
MSDLHSPSWYRVAQLRPRLRGHARIHRHHYRGELWYVLEDRVSRRMHRFNPAAYYIVGLLDGRRTVHEIWEAATERFGDDAPTQDEVIRLLGQLHAAEVLQTEAMPDLTELARRARKGKRKTWLQNLLSPLAIRFPLVDPDRFLERWLPWYGPWFGWVGLAVWAVVVGFGIATAAGHWDELTADVTSQILAPQNLLILWLTFPVVKLLHELGHACAVKAWGGEVHEMGIMLLVLMPIPYVDASAASAFPRARRRVVVGAAGMLVEVFLASIAIQLWAEAEPGLARAVLYDVMLIAGISTIVFNANPLLRYDGYYMLADLVQIPNLRVRANQYLGRLVERRLFGVNLDEEPTPAAERAWLGFYAVLSFLYRTFVICAIALFIASEYLLVGVLLALWALATAVVLPVLKGVGYLLMHPRLRRRRPRALATTALALALLYGALFVLPVPLWTRAEGVIALPEESHLRAGAEGFVRKIVAAPGSIVGAGTELVITEDPMLALRERVLEAEVRLLEARANALRLENRVRWAMTLDELEAARRQLEEVRTRLAELTISSPVAGTFVLAHAAADLPERFLRRGEQVGYVLPAKAATARVLVSQDDVDLVRSRTLRIEAKVAGRLYDTYEARLVREVPAASNRVSNLALSSAGGGGAALDPSGKEPKTLDPWFAFELELPQTPTLTLGEHVYVRFEHGGEPLAGRLYRSVRQLFMRQFTV